MASYKQITPPSEQPIGRDEVLLWLKVDTDVDNDIIDSLISAAINQFEKDTYCPILTQEWAYYLDYNEITNVIWVNKNNISSINKIEYYDLNGDLQELDSLAYSVDINSVPGKIQITQFPQVQDRLAAMKVSFTCGYEDAASTPEDIKTALKNLIGHWYQNRQAVVTGTQVNSVPMNYEFICQKYRANVFGW